MSTPRLSPVWLVLVGILSVQFGAVISKGQFGEIRPVASVGAARTEAAPEALAPDLCPASEDGRGE